MPAPKPRTPMAPVVDASDDEEKQKRIMQMGRQRKTVLGSAKASAGYMQDYSNRSRGVY